MLRVADHLDGISLQVFKEKFIFLSREQKSFSLLGSSLMSGHLGEALWPMTSRVSFVNHQSSQVTQVSNLNKKRWETRLFNISTTVMFSKSLAMGLPWENTIIQMLHNNKKNEKFSRKDILVVVLRRWPHLWSLTCKVCCTDFSGRCSVLLEEILRAKGVHSREWDHVWIWQWMSSLSYCL